jgi:hypothetical protein
MIGKVTWGSTGRQTVATLDDEGNWHVEGPPGPDPDAFAELNAAMARLFAVLLEDSYQGPQDGAYGVAFLHQLAKDYGGKAEIEPRPEAPPGTIF